MKGTKGWLLNEKIHGLPGYLTQRLLLKKQQNQLSPKVCIKPLSSCSPGGC